MGPVFEPADALVPAGVARPAVVVCSSFGFDGRPVSGADLAAEPVVVVCSSFGFDGRPVSGPAHAAEPVAVVCSSFGSDGRPASGPGVFCFPY